MSSQRTRAFVLRSYPYAEADRVVVFFTEEFGLLRGIAKGSRKLLSRVAGALEPLTLVNLMFVEKAGRDLAVITGCEAVRSLYGGLEKAMTAGGTNGSMLELLGTVGVITELTCELHGDRDPNPAQFRLLELVQQALLAGIDPQLVMHYFELFSLRLAGILQPAAMLKQAGAQQLMRNLLRTNLLKEPVPEYKEEDLQGLGRALRRQIEGAVGKKLKAYRFLDKTKQTDL